METSAHSTQWLDLVGYCKPAHCLNDVQSAVGFLTLVVRTCDVRTVLVNFKRKLKIPPILNAAASVKA